MPQKGLDVAVRALPAIRASHPDAVLVIAGEGPEREALETLARELGVGDALFLPGRAGDVAALLERAELLVHPSRWEGFGLVLLEAMLAARPIVATRVSSIPEIVVDGETGVLVPPDDAQALAAAAIRVLDDPGSLGAAGRARALEHVLGGRRWRGGRRRSTPTRSARRRPPTTRPCDLRAPAARSVSPSCCRSAGSSLAYRSSASASDPGSSARKRSGSGTSAAKACSGTITGVQLSAASSTTLSAAPRTVALTRTFDRAR